MTKLEKNFWVKCDGCSRTMGDIHVFLWKFVEPDKDYCPACYNKIADSEEIDDK